MDGFVLNISSSSRIETPYSDGRGKLISLDINELYKRVIEKNILLSNLLGISSFISSDIDVVIINS
jgi:hypothetical protein